MAAATVRPGEHAAAEPAFFFLPNGYREKQEKHKRSYKQKYNIEYRDITINIIVIIIIRLKYKGGYSLVKKLKLIKKN